MLFYPRSTTLRSHCRFIRTLLPCHPPRATRATIRGGHPVRTVRSRTNPTLRKRVGSHPSPPRPPRLPRRTGRRNSTFRPMHAQPYFMLKHRLLSSKTIPSQRSERGPWCSIRRMSRPFSRPRLSRRLYPHRLPTLTPVAILDERAVSRN